VINFLNDARNAATLQTFIIERVVSNDNYEFQFEEFDIMCESYEDYKKLLQLENRLYPTLSSTPLPILDFMENAQQLFATPVHHPCFKNNNPCLCGNRKKYSQRKWCGTLECRTEGVFSIRELKYIVT
jgi:hypothetical protein